MAECEVCGDVIRGKPILVSIDGTKMSVCQKCSKLGVPVETPGSELRNQPAGKIRTVPAGRTVQAAPKKRTRDVYDMMEGELVEDFGERIRAARVAKGLSQKDQALELKEKEGLIKKIETGLIPEDAV
ncbi:MAG: TIGR00270 family protein, partial [Methanomicrobium sp.]|nr:TIGR00270 family protein [Methanomicrobium sp.]